MMQSTAMQAPQPGLRERLSDLGDRFSGFFASRSQWLIAEGLRLAVAEPVGEAQGAGLVADLLHRLEAQARDTDGPALAMGAVPFRPDGTMRFLVPERIHGLAHASGPVDGHEAMPRLRQRREVPSPEAYMGSVEGALARIVAGDVDKVVLARTLELEFDGTIAVSGLLERMVQGNRRGFTFALKKQDGARSVGDCYLVGASPELLVSRDGMHVVANPLAGSRALSDDPAQNRARAAELLGSPKDLREHALVAHEVVETLRPFCRAVAAPVHPSVIHTDSMMHLSTRVVGTLRAPYPSVLELVQALHPTPAVCGVPRAAAYDAIGELEGFDRDLFAGAVGWMDANGDGEWAVTIRCAEVQGGNRLKLFAGAGIVEGS